MIKILICLTGEYGGTDKLLGRYYDWLVRENKNANIIKIDDDLTNSNYVAYDIVIMPSSIINYLIILKAKGFTFNKVLNFIMGSGSFQESYYNPDRSRGIEKLINRLLSYEADTMLKCLYFSNSICFTDMAGMYESLKGLKIDFEGCSENNIIPIAVTIPNEIALKNKPSNIINIFWIGRVSNDFKVIPLCHIIDDIDLYIQQRNIQIDFTIIGNGNGRMVVEEKAKTKQFKVNFVDNMPYGSIGNILNNEVDLLIAMGTSALDGARYGCPTMIVTPVRTSDINEVHYRWIFDSKGYSLGEYPSLEQQMNQVRKSFAQMMDEYVLRNDLQFQSFKYANKFDENEVFYKLFNRELPNDINIRLWIHIFVFYILKKMKNFIKRLINV